MSGVLDLLSYINPFSDNFILSGVLNFLSSIFDYLNPSSDNFLGKKIIELLSDLLQALFVPSDERINEISDLVSSRFGFIDTIKTAINSLDTSLNELDQSPKLTMNLGATKYTNEQNVVVLDFSWYAPFKPFGDLVLTGFIYLLFLWRLFISLPNIINGFGGVVQSDYMVSDIQAYNKFGFGRSNSLTKHQDNKNGGVYRK